MRYGIALGSNVGDRLHNLRKAVTEVLAVLPASRLCAAAPIYETEPVECAEGSLSFYNTVVEIEADIEPLPLLEVLLAIEAAMGRVRDGTHHAPRTLDLDILYAGDMTSTHPRLLLPHPRLAQRRFVLEPLQQICPDKVLPGQTKSVRDLLSDLSSTEAQPRLMAQEWLRAEPK